MATRILLALITSLLCVAVSADVYRWKDEHGNFIFSDTPQPGAEKIELNETTVVPALRPPRRTKRLSPSAPLTKGYTAITITSPAHEETLRNTQGIAVTISVKPKLKDGDQLQLYFDDVPYGALQTNTRFMLSEVERGAHTLEAAIVSDEGKELKRSPPSTFYLHQQSIQNPNAPAPRAP